MLQCKEANPSEIAQAFAQVHEIWPHAEDQREHLRLRLGSAQHRRANWYVGLVNHRVACSLGTYPYTIFGPGGERKAQIFGAVFTPREHRQHGYASMLLHWVMDRFQAEGTYDFLLFSDISPAFYERMGFCALPSFEWKIPAAKPGIPFAPATEFTSFPQPNNRGFRFGISRSADDADWLWAKQGPTLKCRSYRVPELGSESIHLISKIEDGCYLLLETNCPQDLRHWSVFATLVASDAYQRGASFAKGWWVDPIPRPPEAIPLAVAREKEVLMWCSRHKAEDPWRSEIKLHGFRVELSEHV